MTKNIVYDKNGIPKISYRTEKGTVRIKELNNKRLYNKQEVIKYLYFFAVLKSRHLNRLVIIIFKNSNN